MTFTARIIHASALTALALAATACGAEGSASEETVQQEFTGSARFSTALLKDASGKGVGWIFFSPGREGTVVSVSVDIPEFMGGVHGLHVHANDNPANGEGCVADPAQPASTHFVSADGHYNPAGATHGDHSGDMPALPFTHSGKARMSFVTDHFTPEDLKGKAVILHQAADNYGNVPVGTAPNQYTPNSGEATTLTQNTGNAGARIACAVIQ
ncbi:MAG TPA: superoxide dismutase family protein [Polyangiaceae bacterium]|nr:superoxide dismutase family protein [Polyangiaceae bacterium]